jgi:hypothetical protein
MNLCANIRERCGLSVLLTLVESVGLTGLLNDIGVEGQTTTITTVVTTIVATVVLAVVLAVVASILAVVLAVVLTIVAAILSILAVVLALTTTLTTELGVGNTGRKQQRDEGREAHDECSKNRK